MKPATEQIRNLLEIIQHKMDVSMAKKSYQIPISELKDTPDHQALMDKLDWELNAISLYGYPNSKNLDDASIDLYEIEHSRKDFDTYMSYDFSIGPNFAQVYEQYIELDNKGVRVISPNDIHLSPSSYNKQTGILKLGTYHQVEIAQRGKSSTSMDTKTAQCKLMELLFKSDDILKSGITLNYYFKISGVKEIDAKKVKQVKNLQTEINAKFKDVTNLKKLVTLQGNNIKIEESYLLKD